MDTSAIISLTHESLFAIVVFLLFLVFTIVRGRQSLINLIMGLYLALLVSVEFPYYDRLFGESSTVGNKSILMIAVFAMFTFAATFLFHRLMPKEYDEKAFESFHKKLILALLATALVMTYSYHVLPVTDLVDPGSPVQKLFAPEQNFFWWLILPLIALFFI